MSSRSGSTRGSALVLPDSAAGPRALRLLAVSADLAEHADPRTLDVLAEHDLLLDEGALLPPLATPRAAPPATRRWPGPRAPGAAVRRRRDRVADRDRAFGHAGGVGAAPRPGGRCCGTAGLHAHRAAGPPPTAACWSASASRDRELLDAWTRAGTPYLLVRLTEGRAVVGPFVVPGRTACLRCIDAHHTDADPAWPLLVRQYAAASRARPGRRRARAGRPAARRARASAWAARDLAAYVDGRPALHLVDDRHAAPRVRTRSRRRPGCGTRPAAAAGTDLSPARLASTLVGPVGHNGDT